MGDCIFMDFSKGFFAVSDSSNRDSTTSRGLLSRFADMLSGFSSFDPLRTYTAARLDEIRRELKERSEEILQTIPYFESCTFTGILMVRTDEGLKGLLLHTSDSFLLQCNGNTDKPTRVTESNFWMAGRSKRFYQHGLIDIDPEATLIFSTDGFYDLKFPGNAYRAEFLNEFIANNPIEEIPDKLIENYDLRKTPVDDIGMIALHPHRLPLGKIRIIMGGTTGIEEEDYQGKCRKGLYADEYLPLPERSEIKNIL